jgi:hypothetical protein
MIRLANIGMHAMHVLLILFTIFGWVFPQTRGFHLVSCLLILASWFLLGPLIGRPGYCLFTGVQHWIWAKQGRKDPPSYMAYLYQRFIGVLPGEGTEKAIERITQAVLYTCTLLSIYLI